MNGINDVLLLGTVGADPEIKVFNESSRVSTFRMATNENYTDKAGVKKEITEWHNIEAWGLLADTIATYVKKGTHILVRGKIKTENYDDKEVPGRKLYKAKVVIGELHFMPTNKKVEEQTPAYPQAPAYPPQAPAYPPQAPAYPPQAPAYPPQAPAYPQNAPPQAPVNTVTGEQFLNTPDDLPF